MSSGPSTELVNTHGRPSNDKLLAFCSVTIEDASTGEAFVIRDLKLIDTSSGPFVAMPSRKLSARCPGCGSKNHLRARYCNECGKALPEARAETDDRGRSKLHADVAHPINASTREALHRRVVEAFETEVARSAEAGYQPITDEHFGE